MAGDYVNEFTGATGDTSITGHMETWYHPDKRETWYKIDGQWVEVTDHKRATGQWNPQDARVRVNNPCPERRGRLYEDVYTCNQTDKYCVREGGDTCPYYEEYLQELKEEKEDELKEEMELEYEKEELFNEVKNESYYQ